MIIPVPTPKKGLSFIIPKDAFIYSKKILIEKAERETKDYNKITVNIALNYGGRAELVHSVKAIAEKVAKLPFSCYNGQ